MLVHMTAPIYAIAWFKNGMPQHLLAGPFVTEGQANSAVESLPADLKDRAGVVKTAGTVDWVVA